MIKFNEWIKLKELDMASGPMTGMIGAIKTATGGKPDPTISKFVSDIVGDKTGNPKSMATKGTRMAQVLRQQATKDAQKGDYVGAFKKATDAAKMTQVVSGVK